MLWFILEQYSNDQVFFFLGIAKLCKFQLYGSFGLWYDYSAWLFGIEATMMVHEQTLFIYSFEQPPWVPSNSKANQPSLQVNKWKY